MVSSARWEVKTSRGVEGKAIDVLGPWTGSSSDECSVPATVWKI